jgi:hypothetical protein
MGHSDKWWSLYHSLIDQGESESSAAAVATSQIGKLATCDKCGSLMKGAEGSDEISCSYCEKDIGPGWATGEYSPEKRSSFVLSGRVVNVAKIAPEKQLVFGWLSVAVDNDGELVEDLHEDAIPPEELEGAAYEFVLIHRNAGEMHERTQGVGRLVESFCTTPEKLKAMGIPQGTLPDCGWWVGFKVDDPDVWAKIKSGEYAAFSIGGTAMREEADDDESAAE